MLRYFLLPLLKEWAWVVVNITIGIGLIYVGIVGGLSLLFDGAASLPVDFKACIALSGLVSVVVGSLWLNRYMKTK